MGFVDFFFFKKTKVIITTTPYLRLHCQAQPDRDQLTSLGSALNFLGRSWSFGMRLPAATPQDFGEICDCGVKGCCGCSTLFSQDLGVSACLASSSSHMRVVHDLLRSCSLSREGVQDFAVCFFGSCSFCS